MKKGMFSKLFILLLVVGLLFAVAPTQQAKAATTVSTEQELRDALSGTETLIELGASFTLSATVNVNRSVTIDGKDFTITGPTVAGPERWEGHGIQVLANSVTIKNLTITGSARSNLQFYVATGGKVEYVTLSNAANAGMIVNGSTVTITNVTTFQNAWGGINVDQGSGVTATPLLTASNVTTHTSPAGTTTPAIWVDKGIAEWVSANGLYSVVSAPTGHLVFYDKTEFAAIAASFPIHNTTKDIRYVSIQAAINAASTGDIIQVPVGTFTENLLLTKPITLQGEGVTTIIEGDILYQSDTLITGTMTLKNLQVNDSAGAFRMGTANVGVFDAVVIDGVTMGSNVDGTARAISFDADGDGYTLNSLTVKNSTIHSTLAIYLTGKVGAINIDNNDFYITGKHWNGYNAININQYKPASDPSVPAGAYTITNNRFYHPEATTTNGHVGMITNQAVGDFKGIGGGKELAYSGNQLTVGADVIDEQSEFVNDAIAKTNAMTVWIVETRKRFGTIQAAINAAVNDNTIMVASGTYVESIEIVDKNITLKGEPGAIIQPPVEIPAREGTTWKAVIYVRNANVIIDGFTVDGAGLGNKNSKFVGVQFYEAGGALKNSTVINMTWTPFNGTQEGIGLYAYNMVEPARTLSLFNNTFANNQKGDVVLYGDHLHVIVDNNHLTGKGTTDVLAQNGITIGLGATGIVKNNIITNYSYHIEPANVWDWGSAGVLLYDSSDVTFEGGNIINGCDQGIYIYDDTTTTVKGTVIFGNESIGSLPTGCPEGTCSYVVNASDLAVNISGMTLNEIQLATATTEQLFILAPSIFDGTDEAGYGAVYMQTGKLFVTADGSIQSAIDAAASADTIYIAAGVYAEDLEIRKSITLLGPNAEISPNLEPSVRVAEAIIRPDNDKLVDNSALQIFAGDINLTLKGLTFDMINAEIPETGVVKPNDRFYTQQATSAKHYDNVSVYVEKNHFMNANRSGEASWWVSNYNKNYTLTLTDNLITNGRIGNGFKMYGDNNTVTVTDNVWKDNSTWAMQLHRTTGTISGNKFIDTVETGDGWADEQSGLLLCDNLELNITNNYFDVPEQAFGFSYGFSGKVNITNNTFTHNPDVKGTTTGEGYFYVGNDPVFDQLSIKKNTFILDEFYYANFGDPEDYLTMMLEENWWNNPNGPDPDSIVGPVDYIPYCTNAECTEFGGPVYNVERNTYHATIQEAIDVDTTVAGDTITVAPGTYTLTSTINVTKSVTLLGPQANVDPRPIGSTTRVAGSANEAIIDGNGTLDTLININADNVVINGFEITNGKKDLVVSTGSPVKAGVRVAYNIIHKSTGDEGLQLRYVDKAMVEYNYVFDIFGDGLNLSFSTDSTIQFNELTQTNTPSDQNAAIYVYNDGSPTAMNITIQNNYIHDTHYHGIAIGDIGGNDQGISGGKILNNTVNNVGADCLKLATSNTEAKGNKVSNCGDFGIFVQRSPDTVLIEDNIVSASVEGGVGVGYNQSGSDHKPTNVTVLKNQITGNTGPALVVTSNVVQTVNAVKNWWGAATGPATGEIVGKATYVPWCKDAECTEFYEPPVHNVTQGTYFETIQAAITAATAGDTILVAAGEYEENLTINKALTLTGAGADKVTVNGYMVINAPDLTIEGFKFVGKGSDTAIRLLYEIGLTFKNNIVTADDPAVMVLFENNFSSSTAYSNLVITDNKFISTGQQRVLYLNPYYTTLTITGNTFEGSQTTGPVLGLDGLDGNETISGNIFTNITSSYALFETFGVVSFPIPVEPYFAGNTFPDGYYPIGNMIKIPDTKLYMSDDDMMIDLNGPNQVVEVMATAVKDMTAYDIQVSFDHETLQVVSVENGTLLQPETGSGANIVFDLENNGNLTGTLIATAYINADGGENYPVSGGGSLIKITFKPIAFGETDFEIKTESILVSWPNVFQIPYEITGGAEVNVVGFGPNVPFGYVAYDAGNGWLRGVSTDFVIVGADLTGATSLTVKLYSGVGGTTVLQTNTANLENYAGFTGFTSPFDIFGNFGYKTDYPEEGGTTPYWVNERAGTEYGQTELPTCVEATATLAGGTVITKKYCGPLNPGDRSLLLKGTIERDPGNTGDNPGGTPLEVTQAGDTINFKGDIAWYPADLNLGRTEGNRVGVEINAPAGFDTTDTTFIFAGNTYNWVDVDDGPNFVWVYPKVTGVPQNWDIVVTWAPGFEQTFTVNVLEGSTLVQPLLPTITSADVQGPYIPHVPQEFNFTVSNAGGAYYERAIFEYKIDGITLADITKFEFLAEAPDPAAGNWVEMGKRTTEPYIACEGGDTTAICGQFGWAPNGFGPFPTGFTSAPKFRVTFKNGQTADLPMTLTLKGKKAATDAEWTTLQIFNTNIKVYENVAITGTAPAYYLVGDPGASTITITNPTGGAPYGNHIEFNLTIFSAVKADIASATCDYGPIVGFDILGKLAEVDGNLVGTLFPADGAFSVPAPFDMTVTCTMKFNTAKTYTSKYEMVYVVGTDKYVVATDEPSAVVYTKPVITSTDLPTTFQQGVAKEVTIDVNNVGAMYDPNNFTLHLDLPAGTEVLYGTTTYTCTATGCDIPVTLAAGDNALALKITFNAASTENIVISLVDPDRTLATATWENTAYGTIATVNGNITMQGRSSAYPGTDVITLTGVSGYGPYKSNVNAAGEYGFANLINAEYTFTTNQARYLNITADLAKKINLSGPGAITSLHLRGGNAVWTDNIIDINDAGQVGTDWRKSGSEDLTINHGDVNFDDIVNIQDLALVGGNMDLTSKIAYTGWTP